LFFTTLLARPQQYVISTFAGGAPPPLSSVATDTFIGSPSGVTTDGAGNSYFASVNCVFRVDSKGTLTRIAGTGASGYGGDGFAATSAKLSEPRGIALDGSGNIYVADAANGRIRRITPDGIIATVAGNGGFGFSGDGGPAVTATLANPGGVAVDGAGNLFIYDSSNLRIRKVSPNGIIRTIAGNGERGFSGDGGPALNASLTPGSGIAADSAGNVYFADTSNQRIRKIATDGIITTAAGGGTGGDGGPATQASLGFVFGVALDSAGNLYLSTGLSIRLVGADGLISTLLPPAAIRDPIAGVGPITVDRSGNVIFADVTGRIRRISPALDLTVLAGPGVPSIPPNQGPLSARLGYPSSVAADAAGNILIGDVNYSWLYCVRPAGTMNIIGHPQHPFAVAVDSSGNYYAADGGTIVKANFTGSTPPAPMVVAGGGTSTADDIPATSALFFAPTALAADGSGNLFLIDGGADVVRKVPASGIITTFAGGAPKGQLGDGGPATAANMCPRSLATDAAGNLYIGDICNGRIRKVTPSGIISTVAGGAPPPTTFPFDNGDGGPATRAVVSPRAIAVDNSGDLFILEGASVRKVSGGIITTIAGTGKAGYSGDGGPATQATFNGPSGIAVDSTGRVYVADSGNAVVRVLTPTSKPVFVSAVLDAASESAAAITPGKIVVVYGSGLGPADVTINTPSETSFGTSVAGTSILFNGIPAPMIYASANQAAVIAPYGISGGSSVQVVVRSSAGVSDAFTVSMAAASPSMFTLNLTGAGHVAAVNRDGSINTADQPARRGDFISLYATGEGQTFPAGKDGALANGVLAKPVLPVHVTIGGIDAPVAYAGAAPTEVSGLMQVVVYIPAQVQPGGYVPVELQVGPVSTGKGAAWIAVSDQ
ncbi:MAG TPA: IPT/TIG domain-containing protein, partial [Bryobacteraceae bacterium]|nr:IPT/TIG domain-containing protein [Bryobacteraceae bacterium]